MDFPSIIAACWWAVVTLTSLGRIILSQSVFVSHADLSHAAGTSGTL